MAQGPIWQSAVGITSPASSTSQTIDVLATATGSDGSVYVAGTFFGVAVFGTTTLTSAGSGDIFVARWNPAASTFAWAQRAGGVGFDEARAVAVVGKSIYLAGSFNGATADFGSTTLTNASLSNSQADIVVAKLTDAGSGGSFIWAQRAGGLGIDVAYSLAVSGSNIYLAGAFGGDQLPWGSSTLTSAGGSDVFIGKLLDAGTSSTFSWAQQAGGLGSDTAYSLAVSGSAVYVAGNTNSPLFTAGTSSFTGAGNYDGFVSKLLDAGSTSTFVWTQQVGSTGSDTILSLAASGNRVYAAGVFASPQLTVGSTMLTSAGGSDAFVVKLTDAGNTSTFTWAMSGGGPTDDAGYAVAVSSNSVYLAGYFSYFGSSGTTATFGATTLTSAGGSDIFVALLSDAGNSAYITWAQRGGSTGYDVAVTLALNSFRVYVGGSFKGATATFSNFALANPMPGSNAGYLASFANIELASATPMLAAGLLLYPNPAHGMALVRVPVVAGASAVELTLLDALGRVVRTAIAPVGQDYPFDLTGLAPGVYALRVQAAGAQRLVVE